MAARITPRGCYAIGGLLAPAPRKRPVKFMAGLFEIPTLARRLKSLIERSESLKPESAALLEAALMRGEIERGAAPGVTGLPERTARRVLNDTVEAGLLASATPKGPVSLRFPEAALETLFPRLFPRMRRRPCRRR